MEDLNMTTPTPELVHQWHKEACKDPYHGGTFFQSKTLKHIAARAAQWGADQANHDIERKLQEARDEEFRACRQWLTLNVELGGNLSDEICIARRNDRYWGKPPGLKERALALLEPGEPRMFNSEMQSIIRHALEALPDD